MHIRRGAAENLPSEVGMEFYENGSFPENNEDKAQPVNPDLNRGGGIFAEKDYGEAAAKDPSALSANNYQSYRQNGTGAAPAADNAYRQMYTGYAPNYGYPANGQYGQADPLGNSRSAVPQNGEKPPVTENVPTGGNAESNAAPTYGNAPVNGGAQYGGGIPPYNYPPQVGAVPAPEGERKKGSAVWVIIVMVIVLLMFSAVMLLLAFSHEGEGADDVGLTVSDSAQSSSSGGVTVNINVEPKPVENEEFYQNKETGLLTPAGAANQVLPSIVNLYGYQGTILQPYNEASGIIISEDGYIITNAHAVENIERFKAKLNDEREFEAKLVGYDTRTDLAVLKIEADDLVPAVIGSSSDMLQGEEVISIGNAGGFNDTVTVGNVSYVDREIKSYTGYPIKCIQTDAALNFGNSGGALVNLYGQVIGVVVSKYSSTGSENIGFAISSDFAVPIIEDIIEKGYVTGRARIGILYRFVSPDSAENMGVKPGLLISEISEDCDIYNTRLQKDDIITEIDGMQMITENSVKDFQNTHKAGETVTAKVYRHGFNGETEEFEITFKLEEQK